MYRIANKLNQIINLDIVKDGVQVNKSIIARGVVESEDKTADMLAKESSGYIKVVNLGGFVSTPTLETVYERKRKQN